ncbi:MAG: DUF763 domain-containing protein [Dehalococcoidales bacterium]|nr:DUF763 domain-containing protein [Dehalococcoidales bacterium]
MSGPARTGIANLPLHGGKAPRWLFERMVKLAREITTVIIEDYGPEEMLVRLSHPYWFQAFGCILGFDWHSSGVTTTVCGALKEGIKGREKDLGLFVAGGKGAASRKTPSELETWGNIVSLNPEPLVYASRMSAKVDSAAVQDGYQLYHHSFIFTKTGSWAVVQQGMNETNKYARRYHWLSTAVSDFVNEPHSAIASEAKGTTLNLVANESSSARETIAGIVKNEKPEAIILDLQKIKTLTLPKRHDLRTEDLHPDSLKKILLSTYQNQPDDFTHLLGLPGVGAKTIRALSLISELVHGVAPSYRDPARYSFAHGGKDGIPYPVDRETYDRSIDLLRKAVGRSRISPFEKNDAEHRLGRLMRET